MKSLIRPLARAVWRGLAPLRRPLVRKLDRLLARVVSAEVAAALEGRVAPALARLDERVAERTDLLIHLANRSAQESDLVLHGLLRELVRVQLQVEALRASTQPADCGERHELAVLDGEDADPAALRQTA